MQHIMKANGFRGRPNGAYQPTTLLVEEYIQSIQSFYEEKMGRIFSVIVM